MNITQADEVLSIVSTLSTGYSYIHVIQNVKVADTTIVSSEFTDSSSSYTFTEDGYFIISEFKMPTSAGAYYYISGTSIIDPNGAIITIAELMALDTSGTTITRTDQNYITKYFLNDHYITLIKAKFMKDICGCGCGCDQNHDKVKLDALTMGLALIDSLEPQLQYFEVQRIIEKLMVCFGIVTNDCNC